MRRLVLEFPKEEFSKLKVDTPTLQNVKAFEVLLVLRRTEEEMTMICRGEFETEVSDIEDYAKLVSGGIDQVQLIEREKSGSYIVLVKHKLKQNDANLNVFGEEGGYVIYREMRDGKLRMTLLGSERQMKETLKALERSRIRHRIVSLTDAKFSPDSPLNALTEKQRRIIIAAYKLGYYDLPRRISSIQLSEKLGLHKSALVSHRRKAELRLLASILSEL
jgi:predicted DNA binding protein